MPPSTAEFIPFNAINEFMRADFRAQVLSDVFLGLSSLPESIKNPYNKLVRKYVMISGFRNSSLAPAGIKAKAAVKAFEKDPAFAGSTIHLWSSIHSDLQARIYSLLAKLGWEILPLEADRTILPGFLTTWPIGQDFSTLNHAYQEHFPDNEALADDISLMAVWISGRLPINQEGDSTSLNEETK